MPHSLSPSVPLEATAVETLRCAVFRVAEVRVVGFVFLRLLQLSGLVVHTDLCCCCYMGAIIHVY